MKQYTLKLRNNESIGSAYNRGRADSYYLRKQNPHRYEGSPYLTELVTKLTKKEKEEYLLGFQENEASGFRVHPSWI